MENASLIMIDREMKNASVVMLNRKDETTSALDYAVEIQAILQRITGHSNKIIDQITGKDKEPHLNYAKQLRTTAQSTLPHIDSLSKMIAANPQQITEKEDLTNRSVLDLLWQTRERFSRVATELEKLDPLVLTQEDIPLESTWKEITEGCADSTNFLPMLYMMLGFGWNEKSIERQALPSTEDSALIVAKQISENNLKLKVAQEAINDPLQQTPNGSATQSLEDSGHKLPDGMIKIIAHNTNPQRATWLLNWILEVDGHPEVGKNIDSIPSLNRTPGAIQEQLPKACSMQDLENSDDDLLDQDAVKALSYEPTYQGIGSTFSGESPCQEAKDLVNRPKVLEASDQPWKPESLPEIDPKMAQEATQEQVPSYEMSGTNATQQSRSGGCCIS